MMHATGHMYPTGMGQGMEMDPEVLKMAMDAVTLNTVMGIHAFFSLIVGTLLVILPHTLFHDMSISFLAHEVIRCYGAVTIGLGYMAYKLRYIKDGRIRRLLAETYFVVYGVTTISLWKAWISNPSHHTLWALTLIALSDICNIFMGIGFLRPIKTFQLPGAGKGNL